MSDQDRENPNNSPSIAERGGAAAELTGAAAVAVEAQKKPSKVRKYRESLKSSTKKVRGRLKESWEKATKKVSEKFPRTTKAAGKVWDKSRKIGHK